MLKLKEFPVLAGLLMLLSSPVSPADEALERALTAYQQKDFTTAFETFSVRAAAGEARSQTIIGIMYRYGEGVDADKVQAYEWFRKAARQGYTAAQYNIANMLLAGEGIPADPDAGLHWMELAAQNGHARAIGYLETSGPVEKPDQNPEWSRKWDLRLPNSIRFEQAPTGEADNR